MNKKNTPQISSSGIELKDSISISVMRKDSAFKSIPLIIVAFLGLFGTVYTFLSFFEFQYDKTTIVFFTTVFFVVISTIFMLPKKVWFILIPLTLFYEILFIKYRDIYILGYKAVYNTIMQRLNITGQSMQYYRIDESVDILSVTTIFLIFSIFILSLIVVYISTINNNFFLGFLVTFPFAEAGLYYGLIPNTLAFIMLLIFWITLFAMHIAGYRKYRKGNAGFIRKDNDFTAKYNTKFKVTETTAITLIIITTLSILASIGATKLLKEETTEEINNTRAELKTTITEFSIEDMADNFIRLSTSLGNGTTKNTGKLGRYNSIEFKDRVDLTVKTNGNPNQSLYLKGFTGSIYKSNAWDEMTKSEQAEYEDMFSALYSAGNYPQSMLGSVISIAAAKENNTLSYMFTDIKKLNIEIDIASKRGHRYNYLPYGMLLENSEYSPILDETFSYPDKKNYSASFFSSNDYENVLKRYTDIIATETSGYTSFVHSYYTSLPTDGSLDDLTSSFSDTINSAKNSDIYTALNTIRDAIQEDTEYTLSPGKTPSNRDFVTYFLIENKKGYCSHFASAGVLLCRMAGIPARYAEGYVVMRNDFTNYNMTGENEYSIEIKDSRAHAWTEIYLDGVGWIPFEFTPGYSNNDLPYETQTSIVTPETTTPATTPTTTATVTTAPTETSVSEVQQTAITTPPSESSGNPETIYNPQDTGLTTLQKSVVYTIIIVAIALMAIIGIIFMNHNFQTNKRIRSFKTDVTNTNAINIYNYITKLLKYVGISQMGNTHHLDFIKEVSQSTEFISGEDIDFIIRTALEADLSNNQLSAETTNKMHSIAKGLAINIFNSKSKPKQLYMKYIKNLI